MNIYVSRKQSISKLETAIAYLNRTDPQWNLSSFKTEVAQFTLDLTNPDTCEEFLQYLNESEEGKRTIDLYQKAERPLTRFHCVFDLNQLSDKESKDLLLERVGDYIDTWYKPTTTVIWESEKSEKNGVLYILCPELIISRDKLKDAIESFSGFVGLRFEHEAEWFPVLRVQRTMSSEGTDKDSKVTLFAFLNPQSNEKASDFDFSNFSKTSEPLDRLPQLPEYVPKIFETITDNTVIQITKGKVPNLWLIKYKTRDPRRNGICFNGKYHLLFANKNMPGSLIWDQDKMKIFVMCVQCQKEHTEFEPNPKWKMIATVLPFELNNKSKVKFFKPRTLNQETEESLLMELDLLPSQNMDSENEDSLLMKLIEQRDEWKVVKGMRAVGKKNENENCWILEHDSICPFGNHHETGWKMELIWLKEEQGQVQIRCKEPNCENKGWKTLGRVYYNDQNQLTADRFSDRCVEENRECDEQQNDLIPRAMEKLTKLKTTIKKKGKSTNVWILKVDSSRPSDQCPQGGKHRKESSKPYSCSVSLLRSGKLKVQCHHSDHKGNRTWNVLGRIMGRIPGGDCDPLRIKDRTGQVFLDLFTTQKGPLSSETPVQETPKDFYDAIPLKTQIQFENHQKQEFSLGKLETEISVSKQQGIGYFERYFGQCSTSGDIWSCWNESLEWKKTKFAALRNLLKSIKTKEGKSFLDDWLSSSDRRIITKVIWDPIPNHSRSTINLCYGWATSPTSLFVNEMKEALRCWFTHLFLVICSSNLVHFLYLVKYLARIIQNPSEKSGVGIVIISKQGAGKGIIFEVFKNLMGEQQCMSVANLDRVMGMFNVELTKAFLIVVDECSYEKSKIHMDQLKNMITDSSMHSVKKFDDGNMKKNYLNFFFLSNHDFPFHIPMDDRRMAVFEAEFQPQIENPEYNGPIRNTNPRIMHQFLLSVDLNDFNVRKRPITQTYVRHKLLSLSSPMHLWILDLLKNHQQYPQSTWFGQTILRSTLFSSFETFSHSLPKNQTTMNNVINLNYGFYKNMQSQFNFVTIQRNIERFMIVPSFMELKQAFLKSLDIQDSLDDIDRLLFSPV